MAEHTLDPAPHAYWSRDVPVALEVAPGDVVTVACAEPLGQVTPDWTHADLLDVDDTKVHALSGAIRVAGAEPGDTLVVDVLDVTPSTGWGWSGNLPGFGLLAEDFPEPYIHHWELANGRAVFRDGIEVPAEPFPGVVGVAPDTTERLSTIPPRATGGNVDTRDLVAGSTAWLPVATGGALFSVGDGHAAQGDGEVCGTAVETPVEVTLRLDLDRDRHVPRFELTRPGAPVQLPGGSHITTGIGPELRGCAADATRRMVEWLGAERGLDPLDAYLLCSTAAHLRISEVVDAPNWVVSMHLPLGLFR